MFLTPDTSIDLAGRQHPEKPVSQSGRGQLRGLWHRLRLTVAEMNYATDRMDELQALWISDRTSRP